MTIAYSNLSNLGNERRLFDWRARWKRIEAKVRRARAHRKRTAKMRTMSRRLVRPKHTARRGNGVGRRNRFSAKSWR